MPAERPSAPTSGGDVEPWARALACAVVAGDLSVSGIARAAGIHMAEAAAALEAARDQGAVDPDGAIEPSEAWRLAALLDQQTVAEIHLATARHLFAAGPDHIAAAIHHARAAGTLMELEELVAMADQGGRLSLALGDHANARDLLRLAVDYDTSADHRAMALRLLDLAQAEDMLGDVAGARARLAQTVVLGELIGDPHIVAQAAIAHALPADWYAGDPRTVSLLLRAEAMDLADDDRVAVTAARALVEIRIPLIPDQEYQVAWVTRPELAQELAETALRKSEACRDDVQLLAMLAWRSTHRAPEFLARRRDLSTAALDLAQHLREPAHQLVAAVWLAVDALESGDRPLYDRALGVARWVAHSTANPRLLWQAYTLAAGGAFLDGDVPQATQFVGEADAAGRTIGHPGQLGATLLFAAQEIAGRDDPDEMRRLGIDESTPVFANPLGRTAFAYMCARTGDRVAAERHARIAVRQLDPEASLLLLATRLAAVAVLLDADDLVRDLIEVLTPWADHVAVDSNGWWCDGPVALWLALLHDRLGDHTEATRWRAVGEPVAHAINDVRALGRVEHLRHSLSAARGDGATPVEPVTDRAAAQTGSPLEGLTARELDVLRLIVAGYSNPQIATRLSFSLSTIRNDTTVIYRKLGVATRTAAAAEALALGVAGSSPAGT